MFKRAASPLITFHMRGGLGNQLFQATAAAYFAEKLQGKVTLDDRSIIRHADESRRSWLRQIDINELFGTERIHWKNRVLSKFNLDSSQFSGNKQCLDEIQINNLQEIVHPIHVADWFQNSKYAQEVRPKLVPETCIKVRDKVKEQIRVIENSQNIGAIHIRLGDFRDTPWGVLNDDWYVGALGRMMKINNITQVDCYSDELEGARRIIETLSKSVDIRFPEENYSLLPHELLWTMSSYNSFVSSNSSLSWWASFLNRHNSPLVLCDWSEHLFMQNWQRFKV